MIIEMIKDERVLGWLNEFGGCAEHKRPIVAWVTGASGKYPACQSCIDEASEGGEYA